MRAAEIASRTYRDDCGKCGAKRIDSQLGLEKTPEEYVAKMVEIFREVRRVLRKDGTLWLNLGDSYASAWACDRRSIIGNGSPDENCKRPNRLNGSLKEKDLCGIPWRVAFALQADGWYLRSDIIWSKPNPMPESVTDRPTKAHEYLFLLTKSSRYFYDAEAIREESSPTCHSWKTKESGDKNESRNGEFQVKPQVWRDYQPSNRNKRSVWTVATAPYPEAHFATYPPDLIKPCIMAGASARGCCAKCGAPWERQLERQAGFTDGICNGCGQPRNKHIVSKKSVMGGAVFDSPSASQLADGSVPCGSNKTLGWQPTRHGEPSACECENLPTIPCTVLDPFAGSGTTGAVALELGRHAILIELNLKYLELIEQRCNVTLGLALA
jgi:DNA modification methylase